MYTIKYRACDLNDMPEQLFAQPLAYPFQVLQVTAGSYIRRLHLSQKNENGKQVGEIGYRSGYGQHQALRGYGTTAKGLGSLFISPKIRKMFMVLVAAGVRPAYARCQC